MITETIHCNKRIKIEHEKKLEVGSDEDDMFGDDIAFDDLEDISALATPFPEIKVENNNDLLQKELSNLPSPARNSTSIPKEKRSRFIRYMVASVAEGVYQENDDQHYEKNVFLIQEDKKQTTMARLRGDWTHTVICVGDVVHIPFISHTPEVIIDNAKHFIVVHPDRLISCTAVADSFVCTRKSVLQVKVRGISEYTEALVHGNIIHRVIQNALNVGDFKVESIKLEMERVVMDSLKDLYAMDQDEKTALLILNEYADGISKFGSTYVSNKPQPAARVNTDMGVDPSLMMGFETISISKVLDIEEHLWSPTFGIKGMVDASVEMTMSKNDRVIVVPFELKTGKTNKFLTNRAQTLLYTLLMADRYDVDVDAGLLYYSKTNSIYVIPSSHNDLRSLIISRNSLAVAFNNIKVIPPMIKNSHTCQYCFVNDACTIFHKAVERGTGSTSGLFKLFDKKTSHMTDATCKFVEHWWNLLDKEEVDIDYIRKDIWSQPADIREQLGRCLGDMSISLPGSQIDPDMNRWQYSFIRHHSNPNKQLLCNFSTGDPIVISSMEGHTNLAMGFVARISSEEITIDLTEPLRDPPHKTDGFHSTNRQHFNSFVQSLSNPSGFYSTEMKYRIDKDEMTIGMGMLRNNLIQLASLDKEGESKKARLRRLIIDLAKPEFNSDAVSLPSTPYMNPNQRTALKHVLQAEDYTLILGMPGTGKTTTTAEIIRQLVSMGKSVLVAAYTHTALDNVLQKVRDSGVDILRLGNAQKVIPSLRDCVPASNPSVQSVRDMQDFYASKKVVGVTCLGIGDVILQNREFDYCIIDEASQITLPTCIGPLRYAKTFVLVGDLYQLPPIVKNQEACDGGLDKSLFSILAEARPESMCYLEFQYRMNSDIMYISNYFVYGGKLKCGNNETARRRLVLPQFEAGLEAIHKSQTQSCKGMSDCWLRTVLDPDRRVIFINIDALDSKESRPLGSFLQNKVEASLIQQTTEALIQSGITEDQLALVSVYRSQLRLIYQVLKGRQGIEIATIDKYQGRDKDCVIISLVRNNNTGNVGDLLRDWRRLNVAVTRARSKLILFGSSATLKSTHLFNSLLSDFEKKGWVLNLPNRSELTHHITTTAKPDVTPSTSNGKKTFTNANVTLKKNDILKDIYNSL